MWLFCRPDEFVLVITLIPEGPGYDIHRLVCLKSLWRCSVKGFLRIWSLSLSGQFVDRGDPPSVYREAAHVCLKSLAPGHVFLEQSGTALDGITEETEHKEGEVNLAWQIHGILIEERDA